MIYKQTICECLLQKRVCLKSSKSARRCHQGNATSLSLAVCSSSPEVLHPEFLFLFLFSWCLGWGCLFHSARKGDNEILLQGDFIASVVVLQKHFPLGFCCNVHVNVLMKPTNCHASSSSLISGRRLTQL